MNHFSFENLRANLLCGAARPQPVGRALGFAAVLALVSGSGCASLDPWELFPGASTGGGAGAGGTSSGPASCEIDGNLYLQGESFPAPDGCNTCFCDEGGAVACTERACLQQCGGLLGAECDDGQFCRFELGTLCGAADQAGTCAVQPEACPQQFQPVCGCDGQTFSNECFANAAGVSVAASGACEQEPPPPPTLVCESDAECPQVLCVPIDVDGDGDNDAHCPVFACQGGQCVDVAPPGAACGGLIGLTCPDHMFCSFGPEAACGASDQFGACAVRPEVCTLQFDPVCGCDGVTYGNACGAASAGVSVASGGACEAKELQEGDVCGGFTPNGTAACAAGLFCQHQPGDLCGAADATGTCASIPEVCTREFDPVCGCDGETYSNACLAAAAATGILAGGACEGEPEVLVEGELCGGRRPLGAPDCAPGLYCQYRPGALCGAADAAGACAPVPESCSYASDPVCGCDGETYRNACWAAESQVGILEIGACAQ